MNESEIRTVFQEAIRNRLKVNFQMKDTPEGKLILFHPYAEINDAFKGVLYIGLIEKHHTNPATNYFIGPELRGLKYVQLLNEQFEPNHDLWCDMDLYGKDVLLKA